jgi:hypothetical protein
MTIDELKAALADRRIPVIAERTGIHHNTIAAIRDGQTKDPSHRVVSALVEYLKGSVA